MTFNYDRVKNFHEKRLLALNVNYFKAFVAADAAGMRALQREDFYITDVRKSNRIAVCCGQTLTYTQHLD